VATKEERVMAGVEGGSRETRGPKGREETACVEVKRKKHQARFKPRKGTGRTNFKMRRDLLPTFQLNYENLGSKMS